MKDYVKSIKKIEEIRTGKDCREPLILLELRQKRKYTGKLNRLEQGTWSFLSFTTLQMTMRNAMATIVDQHNVDRVLKKVDMIESEICHGYVGTKEDMRKIGIGDASFKTSEKAVGGIVLLLVSKDLNRANPIHWMSKIIDRVFHSSKEAEMLILSKMVENVIFRGTTDSDFVVCRL